MHCAQRGGILLHCHYNRIENNLCNVASDEKPLIVNSTGSVDLNYSFTTHEPNGRYDYYLMYLTNGQLQTLHGGQEVLLEPGMAVIFPPEQEYRYSLVGEEPVQYLWAHFTGSAAAELLQDCGLSGCGIWRTGVRESLQYNFQLLREDFIRRGPLMAVSAASHLSAILVETGRLALEESGFSDTPLSESIQYIHRAFTDNISSADLAAIEHLSIPRYNVLFRQVTGTSPRKYITHLRMETACELLRDTDLSHKQIAQLTGYPDPHYFSRMFHQQYGISPEQYRAAKKSRPPHTATKG